jgi:hypothetical protein
MFIVYPENIAGEIQQPDFPNLYHNLSTIGFMKFGPEPWFELQTSELNCKFSPNGFRFLLCASRFSSRFITSCNNKNLVQTGSNCEPVR